MNEIEKYWVGDNFFDFYIRRGQTWWLWSAVLFAYVTSMGYFWYALSGMGDPAFDELRRDLIVLMGVLCVFLGFVFTLMDAWQTRDNRKDRNEMLRKAEQSKPVSAKHATRTIYSRIKEGLDPEHTLVLKTQLGKKNVKVKDLPDNRIDLPSPKEMWAELFSND